MDRRKADAAGRLLLIGPATLVIGLLMVGPLALMAYVSVLERGASGGVVWGSFTAEPYVSSLFERDLDDSLVLNTDYLRIFLRSFWLSAATTVLCLLVGFPTALYMALQPERRRNLLIFLVTIPFWTNLLIRTFAIQELIRRDGVINNILTGLGIIDTPIQMLNTDFAIAFGMVYVYLPLMVLPIYASMEKLDFRMVEAGYDLYAGRLAVLRRIIIPLVKPGIIAGSILVFIPALGAYVTPALLGGGKKMMISNLISLQFGQGRNWPLGAALSITLMVVVMAALLIYVRNASRSSARTH